MSDNEAPLSLGNDDFDAIQSAVMETARGRWFLAEYAKRNKAADTGKVLEAVERLEGLMRNGRIVTGPDMLQAELVTLTARLAQAKMEIVAHASNAQTQEDMIKIAVRALHKVEGRVTGIAEDLRRSTHELEDPKVAAQLLLGARAFAREGVESVQAMPRELESLPLPVTHSDVPVVISKLVAVPEPQEQSVSAVEPEQPVSVSAARLSALEELANRALQIKKAHAESQAAKKDAASPEKVAPVAPPRPVVLSEKPHALSAMPTPVEPPVRSAPLMQPPAPVNDDSHLAKAEQAEDVDSLFNAEWAVRTSDAEKEELEMPAPQVAVAGQSRSSSMLARSASMPTSFFAGERPFERASVGSAPSSVAPVERRSPFATVAAASKALRAAQALNEKRDTDTREETPSAAPKNADAFAFTPASSEPENSKERFNRQWESVFSQAAPAVHGMRNGDALDTESLGLRRALPNDASASGSVVRTKNVHSSEVSTDLRSANSAPIRAIDALSFEEKSVYFS